MLTRVNETERGISGDPWSPLAYVVRRQRAWRERAGLPDSGWTTSRSKCSPVTSVLGHFGPRSFWSQDRSAHPLRSSVSSVLGQFGPRSVRSVRFLPRSLRSSLKINNTQIKYMQVILEWVWQCYFNYDFSVTITVTVPHFKIFLLVLLLLLTVIRFFSYCFSCYIFFSYSYSYSYNCCWFCFSVSVIRRPQRKYLFCVNVFILQKERNGFRKKWF